MTTLAHNAAVCEVPVDTALLFSGDVYYALWVQQVTERVEETRRTEVSDG